MTLENIFSGGRGNATTTLTAAYVAGTTATINVGDATKLPAAPNIVTILDSELLGNRYAVVQYTGISGNVLTGLTVNDGVPDALQTFGIGSIVTREITRDEWDTIKAHIANKENPHKVTVDQILIAGDNITLTEDEESGKTEISANVNVPGTGETQVYYIISGGATPGISTNRDDLPETEVTVPIDLVSTDTTSVDFSITVGEGGLRVSPTAVYRCDLYVKSLVNNTQYAFIAELLHKHLTTETPISKGEFSFVGTALANQMVPIAMPIGYLSDNLDAIEGDLFIMRISVRRIVSAPNDTIYIASSVATPSTATRNGGGTSTTSVYEVVDGTTVTQLDINNAMRSHASRHVTGAEDPISVATPSIGGLMSAADKSALDDHLINTENPHDVTIEQIGAAPVSHASQHENGGADEINIDASQVNTGIFDIDRIPLAAVPRCYIVADDTARFALTTAEVQNGDTVKVTSTYRMYAVIDDTQLSTESGYTEYKATTDWTTITSKPTSFAPSSHAATHGVAGSDPITVGAAQLSGVITPKADFSWVEDDATVSNTVNFTDASTTGTLSILTWFWDFGDGSSSTEQNPSHTYAGFGIYQVSLTATNAAGQGTITKSITVVSAPIYGYRIVDVEAGPAAKVEYIEACAGFTPVTYNPVTKVIDYGSWGSAYVNSVIHPTVLLTNASGDKDLDITNLALYEDATPSPLDLTSGNVADGDVCARMSVLRYEQIIRNGNDEEHRFCSKQPDPSYVARAHTFGDEVRKNAYLGMFKGIVISSTLYSRYSLTTEPTASTKQDTYRSYTTIDKKGASTYGLQNMHLYDLHTNLSTLFLKTTNFQGTIGNGNSSSDTYLKTGEDLDLTGGILQGDTTVTDTGVMVFWVWNKYADRWEDVDGFVKIEDGKYWVNRTNKDFLNIESLPAECPDNYDEVLLPTPANGYVRRMSGDSRAPLIPIATGSGADSTHHYCDYFYKDVGIRKMIRGGYRSNGADCGPFYSTVSTAPDSSGSSFVARLQGFLAAE